MSRTLDDLIGELSAIGPMHLSKHDTGNWRCSVNLPAPQGNEFTCKSEYGLKTPHAAVASCLANVPAGFAPRVVEVVVEKPMPRKQSYLAGYQQAFQEATEIASEVLS